MKERSAFPEASKHSALQYYAHCSFKNPFHKACSLDYVQTLFSFYLLNFQVYLFFRICFEIHLTVQYAYYSFKSLILIALICKLVYPLELVAFCTFFELLLLEELFSRILLNKGNNQHGYIQPNPVPGH